ncbi:MAG: hypothetical protein HOB73_02575 [Planctomycetaceae bacterium]|jgi:hypothetical protein|nr:hypothetical protein [Planctomycetaceae bacterium]
MSNLPPPQPPPPIGGNPYPTGIPLKSNSKLWIIVVAVLGIFIIGAMLLVVGLGVLYALGSTEERVSRSDQVAIINIDRLLDWSGDLYIPDYSGEKIVKTRFFDGSYDVDYEFDVPEDPNAPYLNCNIAIEKNKADAKTTYVTMWAGALVGMKIFGDANIDVIERDDIFRWGDESTFAILSLDGEPFGNMFSTRKGNRVLFIIFSGIYTDDRELIGSLLLPILSQLHTYAP